jgi:hypothetical protein
MRKFLAMPWNRQNTLFSRETVPLKLQIYNDPTVYRQSRKYRQPF